MALPEVPNYRLLPVIAEVLLELGRSDEAVATVAEAKAALELAFGLSECPQVGGAPQIRWRGVFPPDYPADIARRVLGRMCGEAYWGWYQSASLASLNKDLPLLQLLAGVADKLGVSLDGGV
jgi:hypothetical protein